MEILKFLVIYYLSLGVQLVSGDYSSDCLVVSRENETRSFSFTPEPGQFSDSYQWLVTIKDSEVPVAWFQSYRKTKDSLPGFYAFTKKAIIPGFPDSLYLIIDSVNRSMSSVQCRNIYQNFETREVYGFCKLIVVVKPTPPVCEETRYDVYGNFFEVKCYTYVSPQGICNFTDVKSGPSNVMDYSVQVTHDYTHNTDLYRTTCTLIVPLSEITQWKSNLTFTLTAAPNITKYQNDSVSNNYNIVWSIVRPTSVVCEEVQNYEARQYFQVVCQTYSFPQAICSLANDVKDYRVFYNYEYWYDTKLYKTLCTFVVTYSEKQLGNKDLPFTVTASLNITDYQDYTVSTNFNVLFRQVRPTTPTCDEPRFAADHNFFEVLCQSYAYSQGICRFTSDKNRPAKVEDYMVTYNYEYSSANKMYKTTCTLTVPLTDRKQWNTNLTFSLTVTPNVTNYENNTVSSDFNLILWLGSPVVTSFTANQQAGWVNYNEGDSITFKCTATGTPSPQLSLLNNQGAILYASEMHGTLDYTISKVSCGQSNYTCWADNGWNTSDKIVAVGNCPISSSSATFVPVVQISVGVVGSVLAIVVLVVVVYSCRRCLTNNRRLQRSDSIERLIGSSQTTFETQTSHRLNQPIRRRESTPTQTPNANTGSLFIILATTYRNPGLASRQNRSNAVVTPPPYDALSNSPPEYTEVAAQRVNPMVYEDQPPEYSFGSSMEA